MKNYTINYNNMTNDEPTWALILQAIYEYSMAGESFDEHGYSELARQIAIAKEIDRDAAEVARSISQLVSIGLLNDVPGNRRRGYTLTKDGFDVAHTRSLRRDESQKEQARNKRHHEVNRAIGLLTIGLVFVGLLRATVVAMVGQGVSQMLLNATLGIGLFTVIVIVFILKKSGMLESWEQQSG